jgi:NitT/TauT family transport system substrate-binding protein
MVRFVRASMKGWDYALAHPDEAAEITVKNGAQDLNHQKYMMGEVAKLTAGGAGVLNEAAYQRTEQALLDQKIIQKKPEGAWTHAVTDAAGLKK